MIQMIISEFEGRYGLSIQKLLESKDDDLGVSGGGWGVTPEAV